MIEKWIKYRINTIVYKEVDDLHQRTKEGIETARLNGKQIGGVSGRKLNVKKANTAKEIILKHSKRNGRKSCFVAGNISGRGGRTVTDVIRYDKLVRDKMGNDKVQWGARKAILGDLSPAAAFIAANYNMPVVLDDFEEEAKRIIQYADQNLAWMFETQHVDDKGDPIIGIEGKPIMGRINFAVWSDVFVCPSCSKEIVFWDAAVDTEKKAILDKTHVLLDSR